MSTETTRQLFHLQEIDIEIEQKEQSLATKTSQLGNRETLEAAMQKVTTGQTRLNDLKHQRHEAEWQADDVLSKIKATEQQLYGGKVTNPKELTNLQHELNILKARGSELQDKALGAIELAETAEEEAAELGREYRAIEEDWQHQQEQLGREIEQLKASLAELKPERAQLAGQIEAPVLALYEKIRRQKKPAVTRVEQGICRACRISLSASALQRARSGQPVQCGTCGRILYIS
jgi:predicted  nucleic acid-binding Zn-ribbon protein